MADISIQKMSVFHKYQTIKCLLCSVTIDGFRCCCLSCRSCCECVLSVAVSSDNDVASSDW